MDGEENFRQIEENKSGNAKKRLIPCTDGYFNPAAISDLLQHERRQQWLRILWENSALPKERFERYFYSLYTALWVYVRDSRLRLRENLPIQTAWWITSYRRRSLPYVYQRIYAAPRCICRGTIRAVSQLECCRLLRCIIPLVGALMEY